jgi:hypothetical protein
MISSSLCAFRKDLMITTEQAALVGYEAERQKIQGKIAELQRQLKGRAGRAPAPMTETPAKRGRRRMSAAARKRIAATQKKRWAASQKSA